MANVYVYSGAAGAGTGADWTNAYTTLNAAFTAKAAGDDFWVAHDHAQTQASALSLTPPGTAANPNRVICVNRAGTVPPVSADLRTTATIATTGANSITIGSGACYFYGISISSASGAVASGLLYVTSSSSWVMDQCKIIVPGTTGIGNKIILGASTSGVRQKLTLRGTTLEMGATGDGIAVRSIDFLWQNTASAIAGATVPTTLFQSSNSTAGQVLLEGVDLSALGSGVTLVGDIAAAKKYVFKDCKLGASVTVAATPTEQGGAETYVFRGDSGATNYRSEKYRYEGTQTVETTIVRTGGASDGTTSIAWKLATTANSKRYLPFEALPIAIWNDSTSSVTVTVYGIWGGGAVPTNADIWMDVEYLGSALTPQGSFATAGTADQLATGSNLTTDTSTWGGSTTKFKMTATFTPAQKGAIYIYIKAAAASSTFYIDPKPVLS